MIQVTFFATIHQVSDEYSATAAMLRELACSTYGCMHFESVTEGLNEIAVSLWPDEAAVSAWRNDKKHKKAMQLGREHWYASYRVVVSEVKRDYGT